MKKFLEILGWTLIIVGLALIIVFGTRRFERIESGEMIIISEEYMD